MSQQSQPVTASSVLHFVIQSLLLVAFLTVVIRIAFDYAWVQSLGYGLITAVAYGVGQGIVPLVRHLRTRRQREQQAGEWWE